VKGESPINRRPGLDSNGHLLDISLEGYRYTSLFDGSLLSQFNPVSTFISLFVNMHF
jgi:hypothetical protein